MPTNDATSIGRFVATDVPELARALQPCGVMGARIIVMISIVAGCESAPLQYQSSATFAAGYGCDVAHVTATRTTRRSGSSFEVFDVRGCGLRQIYVCAVDVGCLRPEEAASEPGAGPARKLPPGLVDQAPQPPPVLAPDSESGS